MARILCIWLLAPISLLFSGCGTILLAADSDSSFQDSEANRSAVVATHQLNGVDVFQTERPSPIVPSSAIEPTQQANSGPNWSDSDQLDGAEPFRTAPSSAPVLAEAAPGEAEFVSRGGFMDGVESYEAP